MTSIQLLLPWLFPFYLVVGICYALQRVLLYRQILKDSHEDLRKDYDKMLKRIDSLKLPPYSDKRFFQRLIPKLEYNYLRLKSNNLCSSRREKNSRHVLRSNLTTMETNIGFASLPTNYFFGCLTSFS